jgi:hypothetical protein
VLIHTDKSKTKLKEQEERKQQRSGETPMNDIVALRFLKGVDPGLGIKVATTHSGSMTQEVFYKFAQHCVANLPVNHAPVLLLLDGHGSRWSLQALQVLMENKVYPFFIASHTSIWAKPNDCGMNFRFHRCIEHFCKHRRCGTLLMSISMKYLPKHGSTSLTKNTKTFFPTNITTSAYKKMGMYPFDPMCWAWSEAIDSIGQSSTTERDERQKVKDEIYPPKTGADVVQFDST